MNPAPESGIDIFTVGIPAPDAKAEVLVSTRGPDYGGELSPDGTWLAYHSNESGESQVYVRPFPDVQAGRWQISTTGGTRAAWARDGRELFYLDRDGLLTSVPVQTAVGTFSAGAPVRVSTTRYVAGASILGLDLGAYDVSPDGQRFVMIKDLQDRQGTAPALSHMVIVLNWNQELTERLPSR